MRATDRFCGLAAWLLALTVVGFCSSAAVASTSDFEASDDSIESQPEYESAPGDFAEGEPPGSSVDATSHIGDLLGTDIGEGVDGNGREGANNPPVPDMDGLHGNDHESATTIPEPDQDPNPPEINCVDESGALVPC